MNELAKFKKKIFIETLIKSGVIGVSLALMITGTVMLSLKLNAIDLDVLYYILIFVGTTALLSLASYFIIKPNKIKIAKRLDKQLDLKQKVETMVTYENEDNIILQLQREDTNEKLASISPKSLKMKFHYVLWIALVIGLGFSITSLCIPAKALEKNDGTDDTEEPLEPDFELTEWLKTAINDLITYVEGREISTSVKNSYVAELNTLLENLEECEYVSDAKNYALQTIANHQTILNDSTISDDVSRALVISQDRYVFLLAKNLEYINVNNAMLALDNMRYALNEGEGFNDAVTSFNTNFKNCIDTYIGDKDANLYRTIYNLANSMDSCLASENTQTAITNVFATAQTELYQTLSEEYINFETMHYVENELRILFNLAISQVPDNSVPQVGETEDSEGETGDSEGGGGGTGEEIFGSNDKFFDPIQGDVSYGTVIDEYYAKIMAMYEQGLISEEYRDYCIKYFQYLYSTKENTDN